MNLNDKVILLLVNRLIYVIVNGYFSYNYMSTIKLIPININSILEFNIKCNPYVCYLNPIGIVYH